MAEAVHFHCQYKKFTRAKGQSAVQAAAYRLASRLPDERTGLSHDYTRKKGMTDTLVVTPSGIETPAWSADPVKLWNAVEAAEKSNPRALVMHEWEIALPHLLNAEQRKAAVREMAQFIADRYGCVAMAAFHNPNRNGDQRNYHVHLMFTPRAIGPDGFSRAKFRNYSLRAPEAELAGRKTGAEEIVFIKSQWAAIGNRHLERAGYSPTLDHRSYEDRGIPLEPQKHMGPNATAKERRGERTAKGDFNRAVRDRNQNRLEWARAWEQARLDITGQDLPEPPGPSPAPSKISRGFITLMDNQKQERSSIVQLHITEKKNLWQVEQAKRAAHKKLWARLYRRQRMERLAHHAQASTWKKRLLRKLDILGKRRKAEQLAMETLERRQRIERAQLGRELRKAIREPADRLEDRHIGELRAADARHRQQREEFLTREARNRALVERLSKSRNRGPGRDPSRGR